MVLLDKLSEYGGGLGVGGEDGILNPIPHGGGPLRPPPSGIGDCSKTHLCIDLKLFDFSYISKTKILKPKKIRFFYPTPLGGGY